MSSKNAVKEQILAREGGSRPAPGVSPVRRPTREEIRRKAFEIHIERGGTHGRDIDDWLQAERELEDPAHDNRNTIGEKREHDNPELQKD